MPPPRVIVHLDADAFYASVEQAANPRLRGRPVAVGGERRGIIASASYEARQFGVATPMPTARARKLCPQLVVLPGDYERYEQFSQWMFGYAYDFTPDLEQTSVDEGYLDLTACRQRPAADIAQAIRRAIGQRLKITVSEGIGSNKLVSAIASKLHKPAAFHEVPAGGETAFLHPLPARWLPGVGPRLGERLGAAGLALIRHLAATPPEMLELLVGGQAPVLRRYAHGLDDRPLVPAREPQKTFGQQHTFGQDVTDEGWVAATLRRMADELFVSVRTEGRSVRTLTVKVRYNDFAEDSATESLREPTDLETDVYGRLHLLLRAAWRRRVSLRLVSLRLSNLHDGRFSGELPLTAGARDRAARSRLAAAVDELRRSRGSAVLLRGHDLRLRDAPREALTDRPPDRSRLQIVVRTAVTPHVPLRCHSHYSFLDSTLSPAGIVQLAAEHGMPAVALTDTGGLHGAVEFTQAARRAGIRPLLGAELRVDGHPLLLHAATATGYGNLCRLLSRHAERPAAEVAGRSMNSAARTRWRSTRW